MGAATVSRTTPAPAPGYEHDTWIVGGVISGYWAIGKILTAASPASRMTTEMTTPSTGRSMKNFAIQARLPRLFGRLVRRGVRRFSQARFAPARFTRQGRLPGTTAHVARLRRHDRPGTYPLQSVDNNAVARGKALKNHTQPVLQGSQPDGTKDDFILAVDHIDEFLALVSSDGPIGHQERRVRIAERDADSGEQTRRHFAALWLIFGVGEHAAQSNRACRRVDAVVDEVDDPFLG